MIDVKDLIGKRKYTELKTFDFENMSAEEMVYFRKTFKISVAQAEKKIADYEKYSKSSFNTKANKEYFDRLSNIGTPSVKKLSKSEIWTYFKENFEDVTGSKMNPTKEFIENLKPLVYYFTEDEEKFRQCANVSLLSKPSLDKGLLIVGDYGVGKSATMKVFEKSFVGTEKYFKRYSANEVTLQYEGAEKQSEKKFVIDRYAKGTLYFDDIKSERAASNFGKVQIFREILENRYNNNAKTYLTCNYMNGFEGNLEKAIEEFGMIYGSRVFDRLYEMVNIIEFKGKSFRI